MAITYTFPLTGSTFVSLYNPFYYVLTSTNVAKTNFKFVIDLSINYTICGSSTIASKSIGRFKVYPNPTDNKGYFDAHSILANYVNNQDFYPTITGLQPICSAIQYFQSFGEEYDDNPLSAATGTTIYPALATASGRAINSIRQFDESLNLNSYDAVNRPDTKFLTSWNFNFYKNIYRNEWETTQIVDTSSPSGFYYYYINTFNSTGGTIGQFRIQNSVSRTKTEVPTGTKNLYNLISNNLLGGGSRRVIDTDVDNYYVEYRSSTGQLSQLYGFQIVEDCTKYEKIRIAFLDPLGSYDYWTFEQKSRQAISVKSDTWTKKWGSDYVIGDRGDTSLYVNGDKELEVTSGWLKQHESDFLQKIFTSPSIYLIKTDGTKIPLILNTREAELKKTQNENLINYTIVFGFAHKIYGQNG